jgi:hypothetical protein
VHRTFNRKEGRDHLGDLGVGGKIILKWILKRVGLDWIHVAHGRHLWWAVLYTLMTVPIALKAVNLLPG